MTEDAKLVEMLTREIIDAKALLSICGDALKDADKEIKRLRKVVGRKNFIIFVTGGCAAYLGYKYFDLKKKKKEENYAKVSDFDDDFLS